MYKSSILLIFQEGGSAKDAVQRVPTAQPCIVVRGVLDSIKEAVLVVERKMVTTFPCKELPAILLGAFYVYNMHYTDGCKNLYSFFEVVFLKHTKPTKKTRLSAIIAKLSGC